MKGCPVPRSGMYSRLPNSSFQRKYVLYVMVSSNAVGRVGSLEELSTLSTARQCEVEANVTVSGLRCLAQVCPAQRGLVRNCRHRKPKETCRSLDYKGANWPDPLAGVRRQVSRQRVPQGGRQ